MPNAPDRVPAWLRRLPPGARTPVLGAVLGLAYGLTARFVADNATFGAVFVVMSIGFVIFVPYVLGVLAVRHVEAPSRRYRIFAPWIPTLLLVLIAALLGWEGMACIIMALPALLFMASMGGLSTYAEQVRSRRTLPVLLVLPYLIAPVEQRIPEPERSGETVTEIDISAPPSVVWPLIASVDSIRPSEQRPALYLALGFPKPISATLSREGVGGIRRARFEHGLTFTETVTDWSPPRRLSFTIDANTDSVPPNVLDAHVMVGTSRFDVMTGTYELHPLDGGRRTRLVLRSTHRLATRFNPYAEWWVNRVMSSIQAHISEVHKRRAEAAVKTSPVFDARPTAGRSVRQVPAGAFRTPSVG